MAEGSVNLIEQEIEALSREIEIKRRALEAERGVVAAESGAGDKEILRAALAEKLTSAPAVSPSPTPPAAGTTIPAAAPASRPAASKSTSYIDDLDEVTAGKVNALIQQVFAQGIEKTLSAARAEDPYVMDAFHDALTDRLYDELKKRKQVE